MIAAQREQTKLAYLHAQSKYQYSRTNLRKTSTLYDQEQTVLQ